MDASFFKIFSFPLIKGNVSSVLQSADGIVLSESRAFNLFGTLDIIGETVFIDSNNKFTVTGIMEDFPENTHFEKQDAIVNLKAFKSIWGFETIMEEYGWCSISIYFLAKVNTNLPAKAPEILENFKKNFWLYKEGWANTVEFTPLKNLYFSSKQGSGTKSNSRALITVLSVIVFIILLLAVGNYINLTIAQSTFRGKEVAMKKLLGSSKKRLVFQLVKESVFLCILSLLLALLLAILVEPIFNSLLNTQLLLDNALNITNLMVFLLIFTIIGLLSGIVPAMKISSFKPIEVVNGGFRKKSKGIYAKGFITFQYTVTIALLVCSWIILKQTEFLRNYDLGFQKDNIIQMEYLGAMNQKSTIKDALMTIPGVKNVSITWQSQLSGGSNQTFDHNGKSISFQEFAVDSSFYNVFGFDIKKNNVAYSENGVFLNETGLKTLELKDGENSFRFHEDELPILGVVNDFNFKELRNHVGPLMIRQLTPDRYADNIFLKVEGKSMFEIAEKIKSVYGDLIGDVEFDINFVDESINQWYEKDERTGKVIGYFTLLSFIISAMGILAMSTFYTQQRKKEIGIRKVNGANIAQVLSLLNKDFLKWVLLAFFIAVPISLYTMNRWLENFAYKTKLSWWIFVLAGVATLVIAFVTISWQSFKAAMANPVDALRNE
ncbi:MAG: FtsX-like permease family protein [Muricauda sp.]|nr:FtsX-like permease family protein [Allomuricauda sp.]